MTPRWPPRDSIEEIAARWDRTIARMGALPLCPDGHELLKTAPSGALVALLNHVDTCDRCAPEALELRRLVRQLLGIKE